MTSLLQVRKELFRIITPELLDAVVEKSFPISKKSSISTRAMAELMVNNKPNVGRYLYPLCYSALERLSQLGLEELLKLEFTALLPSASSPEFPKQALGLVLLLDLVPRVLFSTGSTNIRYVGGFFNPLALKLALQLIELPKEEQPDRKDFWIEDGYAFEFWVWVKISFYSPLVHAEDIDIQNMHLPITVSLRKEIWRYTNIPDPYATKRRRYMDDNRRLYKMLYRGFGVTKEVKFAHLCYWFFMLFDVHHPVIRDWRRFPYRNSWLGRESTDDEQLWLDQTLGWGVAGITAIGNIKNDVKKGVWTPLKPKKLEKLKAFFVSWFCCR